MDGVLVYTAWPLDRAGGRLEVDGSSCRSADCVGCSATGLADSCCRCSAFFLWYASRCCLLSVCLCVGVVLFCFLGMRLWQPLASHPLDAAVWAVWSAVCGATARSVQHGEDASTTRQSTSSRQIDSIPSITDHLMPPEPVWCCTASLFGWNTSIPSTALHW